MNISQQNVQQYNQSNGVASAILGSIHFGGYSLMTLCDGSVGVAIQNMNAYDLVAELDSYESSVSNGGGIINKRYPTKTLNITLFVQGSSQSDLIARIDALKLATQGVERDFGILVAGEYRTYKATVSSITVPAFRKYDTGVDGIEMELLITSPFWVKNQVVEQRLGVVGNIGAFIQNQGQITADPVIICVLNAGTSASAVSIEIKRAGEPTGYTLTITTPFVAGDILALDFGKKTCQKNGVNVNFTGIMRPIFDGANIVQVNFTGTAFWDFSLVYSPTFL